MRNTSEETAGAPYTLTLTVHTHSLVHTDIRLHRSSSVHGVAEGSQVGGEVIPGPLLLLGEKILRVGFTRPSSVEFNTQRIEGRGAVFSFPRDRSRCVIKSCTPKNQIWDKSRNQWYLSHSGCGIKSGIHTTFLARNCGSLDRASSFAPNPCRKPPKPAWAGRTATS